MAKIGLGLGALSWTLVACGSAVSPAARTDDATAEVVADAPPRSEAGFDAEAGVDGGTDVLRDAPREAEAVDAVEAGFDSGTFALTADGICGVSVAPATDDRFAILYAVRAAGESEVRLTLLAPDGTSQTTVLQHVARPGACVARRSLASTFTGYEAAWSDGADAIETARLARDGTVMARAAVRATGIAPVSSDDAWLAFDLGQLVYRAATSGAPVLAIARVDFGANTVDAGFGPSVAFHGTLALPGDVYSVGVSTGVAAYAQDTTDGRVFVRTFSEGPSPRWTRDPVRVGGLGFLPLVASLDRSPYGGTYALVVDSGQRNRTVAALTLDTFDVPDGGALTPRTIATDTAWYQAEGASFDVAQSWDGGHGTVWSSHGGGGYNVLVRWRADDAPETHTCTVLRAPAEDARWRGFSFAQRGARNKVFAAILTYRGDAGVQESLVVRQFADGEGLCER